MKKILFVCHGNICRSPSAEGIARQLIEMRQLSSMISVDSAGTHDYHVGEPPDPRAIAAAHRRGFNLSPLKARKVQVSDFNEFDLVLAMDRNNLSWLSRACPEESAYKLGLLMQYARQHKLDEVPDPYFGGEAGFERVLDLLEDAISGLIESLTR